MDDNDRAITSLVVLSHSLVHTYEFAIPIFIPIWLAQFDATAALVGGAVTVGLALYGIGSLRRSLRRWLCAFAFCYKYQRPNQALDNYTPVRGDDCLIKQYH